MKHYVYFVSYSTPCGTFGNGTVRVGRRIMSFEDIQFLERKFRYCSFILNFQLLRIDEDDETDEQLTQSPP